MQSWIRGALDEGIVYGRSNREIPRSYRELHQVSPWDRGMCLALAKTSCAHCHELGSTIVYGRYETPCRCVLRKVFRLCLLKYRELQCGYGSMHSVRYDLVPAKNTGNRAMYSRPKQEFVADFEVVARRAFRDNSTDYKIFQLHHLAGVDWKECSRLLHVDRGNFFHAVYRVEERLGRLFFETKPYPLYPTQDYFRVKYTGGNNGNGNKAVR